MAVTQISKCLKYSQPVLDLVATEMHSGKGTQDGSLVVKG